MKDLFDAVKEAYSQSEPSPAEGGWQKVSTSMRRTSVLRTLAWSGASIAACAAIAMLFVRTPHSGFDTVPASRIAEVTPSVPAVKEMPEETTLSDGVTMLSAEKPELAQALVARAHVETDEPSIDREVAETETAGTVQETTDSLSAVSDDAEAQQPALKTASDRDVSSNEEPQPYNWWADEPAPKNKRHLKVGLNVSASPMSSATSNMLVPQMDYLAVLKSNTALYNFSDSEKKSAFSNFSYGPTSVSYSHDLPIGLGIALNFPLTDRFSIETGLNYTYLHSVEDNFGSLSDQKLHFAGIPLRASYAFIRKGTFSLYAGAGTSVEKCLRASIGSRSYDEKHLQWAGEAFAGAELKLWKSTSLYLQPTVSYWFTDTDLVTYRTENPLVFSVNAGLRFHL